MSILSPTMFVRKTPASAFLGAIALFAPLLADAAYAPITYRYDHYLFALDPDLHPEWSSPAEAWFYYGRAIAPPEELLVDGDVLPTLPPGFARNTSVTWDTAAIAQTIREAIAAKLDRVPGAVTIKSTGTGIVFEGVGLPGRTVDALRTAELTVEALKKGITEVILPVEITQPQITVQGEDLIAAGIKEVVTVGESEFIGSAVARRHNIAVGLARFNGHLIPQGSVFSFNEVLGPVNASTGYRKELVIQGERTLPDYGGGLCQVSTTAYRGIWEYGFPIEQRKNHSYTVRYYSPVGTDATIYPPSLDMKFTNDSPAALLLQTHVNQEDSRAYFIYYGTRDDRTSDLMGPFAWGHTAPPPDRTEFTTEIPAGTTRKVGDRVPGVNVLWYRSVKHPSTDEKVESFFSSYQARPRFDQIGVSSLPDGLVQEGMPEADVPSWIGE